MTMNENIRRDADQYRKMYGYAGGELHGEPFDVNNPDHLCALLWQACEMIEDLQRQVTDARIRAIAPDPYTLDAVDPDDSDPRNRPISARVEARRRRRREMQRWRDPGVDQQVVREA
jgi:hypothetical protein